MTSGCFNGCSSLTYISIPSSVKTISGSLQDCNSLTIVNLPDSIEDMSYSFTNCINLNMINLPNALNNITGAFQGSINLAIIVIDPNVTNLNIVPFNEYPNLTNILFDYNGLSQLTNIPSNLFKNCIRLSNVVIPDSVININSNAFQGSSSSCL